MSAPKLITVELKSNQLWIFRIARILVSIPFILNVYETTTTNIALVGKFTYVQGEHWGYYAYLFKNIAISTLFVWLGTFGSKAKPNK